MARLIKFSILPKGAERYALWMLTFWCKTLHFTTGLHSQPQRCPFYLLQCSVCQDSAWEVPKEEEESVLFPLPLLVLVFLPPRAEWFGPSLFSGSPAVGSSLHPPPSHTCTCSAHTHPHPPCHLRLTSLSPSTCCWPLPMWPDGAPSSRSLCRRMNSFLNIVVR